MKPILLSLFTEPALVQQLQILLNADLGRVNHHAFPDGEDYLQIQGDISKEIEGRNVIVFDSLHQPDTKTIPLIFLAETARELGAKRVGLVCPYLAYMRQDKRFHPGEAITSTYFARVLSEAFDWVLTVDPHLHRRHSLDEIYTIPSQVIHATDAIVKWVMSHVEQPLFIGPDAESVQWVSSIARLSKAPFVILEKTRTGDREVSVTFPDMSAFMSHTPVLVDDIISTARTMIETVVHVNQKGMNPPVCIGVHGIFAGDAYISLIQAGASKVVTCNTIPHPTNGIDLMPALSEAILQILSA
ncbi:MAG: ribose-phosphate pyrophosphokinase [Alphaproteobacteria bacterium]|jgi:ribose-phosphate pyrophosphokinase|nr:ribose-phosphate pyrophosphokinase [Alphaproteobacteria bacterium]